MSTEIKSKIYRDALAALNILRRERLVREYAAEVTAWREGVGDWPIRMPPPGYPKDGPRS